jgi:hypothetical protein
VAIGVHDLYDQRRVRRTWRPSELETLAEDRLDTVADDARAALARTKTK